MDKIEPVAKVVPIGRWIGTVWIKYGVPVGTNLYAESAVSALLSENARLLSENVRYEMALERIKALDWTQHTIAYAANDIASAALSAQEDA